jgi:hypothetical protein
MEKFASTDTLMKMLEEGRYKRLVMENDEDFLVSEDAFDQIFENYKNYTARPDNYDYFARRQLGE